MGVRGTYKPPNPDKTGMECSTLGNGQRVCNGFGQINFKGNIGFRPTLRFSLMQAGTNTLHTVQSFKWSFPDMDRRCSLRSEPGCKNIGNGNTSEAIEIENSQFSEFYLHNGYNEQTYSPGQSPTYGDILVSVSDGTTKWLGTVPD